jgi:hypothetical protein
MRANVSCHTPVATNAQALTLPFDFRIHTSILLILIPLLHACHSIRSRITPSTTHDAIMRFCVCPIPSRRVIHQAARGMTDSSPIGSGKRRGWLKRQKSHGALRFQLRWYQNLGRRVSLQPLRFYVDRRHSTSSKFHVDREHLPRAHRPRHPICSRDDAGLLFLFHDRFIRRSRRVIFFLERSENFA